MRFRQIHLDFHTGENIPEVGQLFNKEQFQEALKIGHVDSITVFSKCHHGWSYHPTKANEIHPSLKFDLLGAQLEACAEIGVRAPVYISAGLDEKEARRHPEWLYRRYDETLEWAESFNVPGYHRLCFNTGYMDHLLGNVAEVMEIYNPVEIFLDICSPVPCCCSRCRADMKAKGLNVHNPDDVMKNAEDVFAAYAEKIRTTIEKYNKDCAIFHNFGHLHCGRRDLAGWQTHLELESLPTGGWGYDDFPFSALYAEKLDKEYLGMTGKFHKSWGEFGGFKHPNALRYEVALAAALGAGSSVGDQLHPSGKADMTTYRLVGEAYAELETKEPWCKETVAIADIGLLSSEAVCVANGSRASRIADIGANRMLLEGKYLYSVIDTESDFSKYKLLVLPDNARLNKKTAEKLTAYINGGGQILCSGESGLNLDSDSFAVDLGVKYVKKNEYKPTYLQSDGILAHNNGVLLMYADSHIFECSGAKRTCGLQNPYFNRTVDHFCSHAHTPNDMIDAGPGAAIGKNGGYIGWNIFTDYAEMGALQCKELVIAMIEQLLSAEKTVTVENLPDRGIITLRKTADGRLINHLLFAHTTTRGRDTQVIEDLLPVHNVKVTINLPGGKTPKSVRCVPEGKDLAFTCENGVLSYTVESFTCHRMIEIAY